MWGSHVRDVPVDDDSGVVRAMGVGKVGISKAYACGGAHGGDKMRLRVEKRSLTRAV